VIVPSDLKRVPTKYFSYVMVGDEIYIAGGQFPEDRTCSIDTFKLKTSTKTLKECKSYLKQARMQHSMIYIEEKGSIIAVGGEDEN
jgi:hypothetical protein